MGTPKLEPGKCCYVHFRTRKKLVRPPWNERKAVTSALERRFRTAALERALWNGVLPALERRVGAPALEREVKGGVLERACWNGLVGRVKGTCWSKNAS